MRTRPVLLSFRVLASAVLLAGLTTLVTAQTAVTVSGTVTGGGDRPIAGATVEFFDITHVPAASAVTDGDGRYSVQITAGIYDIRVTPPAGSGLLGTNLTGRSIGENTTINIALIEPGAAILTGRVLDGAGAGIAGAYLSLQPASSGLPPIATETDAGGNYRFDAVRGTYVLTVNAFLPSLEPHRPQSASVNIQSLALEGDRVLDLRLPVRRVDVHVQDADGHAVAGVGLSAAGVQNCSVVLDGLTACVSTSYSYYPGPAPMPPDYPQPLTDAAGNFTLWLVDTPPMPPPPMPPMGGYTITATPPPDLGLPATAVQNVVVSGDTTLTIALRPALELRGRLLDGAGMAIAGVSVSLQPSAPGLPSLVTETDFSGAYRFSAPEGTYSLFVRAWMPWLEPNRPQSMSIQILSLPLSADRVLDLTVPLHRVDVHVQDGDGNPVPGAGLSATAMQNCSILFDGLAGCVSSSYSFSPAPMPGMPDYPQPVTNASGDFTMWLVATLPAPPPPMPPMGGYTITATPPAVLGLPATAVPNIVVTGDTEVTITLQRALELRGRFLDAAGMPIVEATVSVMATMPGQPPLTTQTDLTGTYRFSVPPGTYSLYAYAWLPWLAPNRPQMMSINISSLTLTADRVLDLAPPLHRVDIHVQDAAARPVAGVGLSASAMQNCQVLFDGVPGCVWASYSYYSGPPMPGMPEYPQPVTNASGDFTMWLAATAADPPPPMPPMGSGYTLMATPPAGGPFSPFALSNVAVAGATQLLIALQFVHPSPVSSATLSPAADANGEYPDPVLVTLASSAAPGQSIARIEYQADAGTVQTYAGPFIVSGGGSHELRFWATDTAGVYEAPQTLAFTIASVPTLPEIRETLAELLASGNIDNEGVYNSLATKLRDEGQLQAFLNELDAQRGKHISEAAYARLAADVRKFMQQ